MIEEKQHQHRLELHPRSRKMRRSTYTGQVGASVGPGQAGSTLKLGTLKLESRPDVLPDLVSTPLPTSPDVRRNVRRKTDWIKETYDVTRGAAL